MGDSSDNGYTLEDEAGEQVGEEADEGDAVGPGGSAGGGTWTSTVVAEPSSPDDREQGTGGEAVQRLNELDGVFSFEVGGEQFWNSE